MASSTLGKRKSGEFGSDERTPKRQNVAELYAPTMVTIEVSNSSVVEEGEESAEEQFQVPRGLICAYSAYFDSVFRKQFAESGTGRSVLDDVRPWTFRVFIGWLYFQRISYTGDRTEPKAFASIGQTTDMGTDASVDDDAAIFALHPYLRPPAAATLASAVVSSGSRSSRTEVTSGRHKQCTSDNCTECEEPDDEDSLTWEWRDLFELYVFGEKYDTRSFRMDVLLTMQKKRITKKGHALPTSSALNYLFDNIPAGAPILDMMAKMQYEGTTSISTLKSDVAYYSALPAPFLTLCLLSAAKRAKALRCKECYPGKGRHSHSYDHSREDLVLLEAMDNCKYHEHDDNAEEMLRCKASMDAWNEERLRATRPVQYLDSSD